MIRQWLTKCFGAGASLPPQWQNTEWNTLPWLAIDLELTSLDAASADLVSIGWVKGEHQQICLQHCYHAVINTDTNLQQSPLIHGLTEAEVREGCALKNALRDLQMLARDHVWVFHHAGLDLQVLQRMFRQCDLPWPGIVAVDTLKLAHYEVNKRLGAVPAGSLSLGVCRERLNLPLAPAHNALDDAMATLQLLFALLHQLDASGRSTLRDLQHTGAVVISPGACD